MDLSAVIGLSLLVIVIPVGVALAVRQIGSGTGLGLVELFESALAPFAAPQRAGRPIAEPEFERFKLESRSAGPTTLVTDRPAETVFAPAA